MNGESEVTAETKATDPEFLYAALGAIVALIERCGASIELTQASSLAAELRRAVGNQWNTADAYALERVKTCLRGQY
jgi:hypothetical protein